ncbi:unnamed protein product [Malus baccata var. baccata]
MPTRTSTTVLAAALLLIACSVVPTGEAIWMKLPSSDTKCVSEEIQNNVVVLGDYGVISHDHNHSSTISVKVTSPYGNNLHHRENATDGQFAFTTQESGTYLACFSVDGNKHEGSSVSLNLDWKIGIAAQDWDSVARKEKIEGVELELRKLEQLVKAVILYQRFLKAREVERRNLSEGTNSRVARYSMMSLGLCIGVSCLQLWHLKRFFRKKKII